MPAPRPPSRLPPYTSSPAQLFYLTNHRDADARIAALPHGPVGFDLEWRPNRKGRPENRAALVQLATADTVMLIHVHHMTQFPSQLAKLLGSPAWVKAGVNIQYDCKKLYRDYGISVRNCVELSLLARTVDNARWKGPYTAHLGLARLVETYEQVTLSKPSRLQCSNWERHLNLSQQMYAANDAHAGFVVYSRLLSMAQAMDPIPHPSYYSFSLVDGQLRDSLGISPWRAHNPYYDPGPPPPPKTRKLGNDGQQPQDPPLVAPGEPQRETR